MTAVNTKIVWQSSTPPTAVEYYCDIKVPAEVLRNMLGALLYPAPIHMAEI
jgi:hypothetical protein